MTRIPTRQQISAGGVAFRIRNKKVEVALISVGDNARWQLPKGIIEPGETSEAAAVREVGEEAGIQTRSIRLIDKVEYWYYSKTGVERVRFHKFVYFHLLEYESGDVKNHDHEVNEARWVPIDDAIEMLAFESEKKVTRTAKELIDAL